jgi:peptide/nickel transport system substrate-binding protein
LRQLERSSSRRPAEDGRWKGNSDATIIMGTTDTAIHFDPANAYDLHSWNIIYNVYDELMTIPPGGNKPVPSLATSCGWDDPKTYTCHLRSGVKFQNGDPLTSKDVEFSFQRSIVINGDQGACYLFSSLATCGKWKGNEISTPDPQTVTFHLTQPDATWPFILATGAAAIVPSGRVPGDEASAGRPADRQRPIQAGQVSARRSDCARAQRRLLGNARQERSAF